MEDVAEAGCDEAGRGCLAGPVVAAAVILPKGWTHPLLNDSKQMSEKARNGLRTVIEEEALHWAVGWVWPDEIDRINILNASFLAMHRALDQLGTLPGHLLIDGNRFTAYREVPHMCVVQGDGKYCSIAAASVLAKTHRDAHMARLHEAHPHYGWVRNKGYPTRDHRHAIATHGHCQHHRLSFALLPQQPSLFEASMK
jgi:ribonuclease HII